MDKEMRKARKDGKKAIVRAFSRGVINVDNVELEGFRILRNMESYADRVVHYRLREIFHRTTVYDAIDSPFVYIIKSSYNESELHMLDAVIILKKTAMREGAYATPVESTV